MPHPSILTITEETLEQDKLLTALKKIGYTHIITADSAKNGWAVLKTLDVGCVIATYDMSNIFRTGAIENVEKKRTPGRFAFFFSRQRIYQNQGHQSRPGRCQRAFCHSL